MWKILLILSKKLFIVAIFKFLCLLLPIFFASSIIDWEDDRLEMVTQEVKNTICLITWEGERVRYWNFNISHKLLSSTRFLEICMDMKPLPLCPYSLFQHIGRVATPKPVPKNCFRYLHTTLIIGQRCWSQNLYEVLSMINEE